MKILDKAPDTPEVKAHLCPRCKGAKKVVADLNAYNQLTEPVRLSEERIGRRGNLTSHRDAATAQLHDRAFSACPECGGEGVVYVKVLA